ncbi:hypothetical protein RND81_13G096500 [Saponaria officinalis]|uniref:SWIM-type domain-containing protein n=1 Tax=Saponaria officinalis TaxID=3572 RepID=A0AAW1H478_SAPOF
MDIPGDEVPHCPEDLKPSIGKTFSTLEEDLSFYKEYAKTCGFTSRLDSSKSVKGTITHKQCICSKEGHGKQEGVKRKRAVTRVGCDAKVNFKRLDTGEYVIYDFVEGHNHAMITPDTMVHLKSCRDLNLVHKKMIMDNSRVNHGPVKTFRMFKEILKNFSRDVKKFLKDYDAQMLIETFMQKKSMCPSFYFDFDVDFDNHKRCVTFAAGVIAKENAESFTWLFENFVKAMGGWIPAYFRDTYLGGIMRTTSRSESENSFFGNFTNPHLSLVEFWMRYQTAMDAQRWKHSKLTPDSKNSSSVLATSLLLEKHASEFYTPSIFYEFQEKLKESYFRCGLEKISTEEKTEKISVIDRARNKVYEVVCSNVKFSCSCKRFERYAILCRHVLWVLNTKGYEEILGDYLLDRWHNTPTSKKSEIEILLGSKIPTQATVLPPKQSKNKGSGRRMISEKEKAVEEHSKPLRKCRACGQMANHDSRNCDKKVQKWVCKTLANFEMNR